MKAVQLVGTEALSVRDVPTPAPGAADVLIAVRAAGLCETDLLFLRYADMLPQAFGVALPLTMGHEFSGEVVEVGRDVVSLRPGDRVVVEPNVTCGQCPMCVDGRPEVCAKLVGIGQFRDGGFAEYAIAPASHVHRLPAAISFEVGALVEPLACAAHGFRRTHLRPGEDVLMVGDGFFGLVFADVARALGARRVAILGHHESRLEIARSRGVDLALDERAPERAEVVASLGGGFGPQVVVDTVGTSGSMGLALRCVRPGGRIGLFGAGGFEATVDPTQILLKAPEMIGLLGNPMVWPDVLGMLEAGRVDPSGLITHRVPLLSLAQGFALKASRAPDVLKVVALSDLG